MTTDAIKLATLQTGAWRPNRRHKAETQATRQRHNTKAVRVNVTICDAPELAAIIGHHDAVGRTHRAMTLPTPASDMRMLVSGKELEHADMMRQAVKTHEALVSAFMAVYPRHKAEAPARLNGLYEPEAWPDVDAVRAKFRFTFRYLPCPAAEGQWGDWIAEMRAIGAVDLRSRVETALRDYVHRLRHGERLHAALIDDITDAVGLARAYRDVADTATATAAQAMASLDLDLGALRENKQARAEAAKKAESLLSVFGGLQ